MNAECINRVELSELLAPRANRQIMKRFLRGALPDHPPKSRFVWACWPDDGSEEDDIPRLIITTDEEIHDFFAWAMTFLPPIKPLTAFIRIIPWSIYKLVDDIQVVPNGIDALIAGVTLGEAMIHSVGRGFIENLTLTAFEGTYSASLGRAVKRGFNPELLRYTNDNWLYLRELTNQPQRHKSTDAIEDVWAVILRFADRTDQKNGASASSDALYRACREIRETGELSHLSWDVISEGRIYNPTTFEAMNASKERRVEIFEKVANEIMEKLAGLVSASFLVAYLASLISRGSLEHSHLLLPLQEHLPMLMPWYGLFAGLTPGTRILSEYGYLGLRLNRTMGNREDILSLPNCDISIYELEILLRSTPRAQTFRQSNVSYIRVEISPGVTTVLRWPSKSSPADQLTLFGVNERPPARDENRRRLLLEALRRSMSIAEELIVEESLEGEPGHFLKKGKKRR